MTPKQHPGANAAESDDGSVEDHLRATPDEAGPHDVPDDEVIEKTLPSKPGE